MADGPGSAGPAGVVPDTAALQLNQRENMKGLMKKPRKSKKRELNRTIITRSKERTGKSGAECASVISEGSAEKVLFILSAFSSASVSHILDGF